METPMDEYFDIENTVNSVKVDIDNLHGARSYQLDGAKWRIIQMRGELKDTRKALRAVIDNMNGDLLQVYRNNPVIGRIMGWL
jgi:hypothetical protein